jgi:hypothetical protein
MNESFTSPDDRKESFMTWGVEARLAHAELKGTLLTSDVRKGPFTASDAPKDTFSTAAQRDFAGTMSPDDMNESFTSSESRFRPRRH